MNLKLEGPTKIKTPDGTVLDMYRVYNNGKDDLVKFIWRAIQAGQRVLQVYEIEDKQIGENFGPQQGSTAAFRGGH